VHANAKKEEKREMQPSDTLCHSLLVTHEQQPSVSASSMQCEEREKRKRDILNKLDKMNTLPWRPQTHKKVM
jgi:hypothetical protein